MSVVLTQLAVAIGGILFLAVLVITLSRDVPLLVAVFRGLIVMCVSSVIVAVFFRYFSRLLYRFVAEEVLRQQQASDEDTVERNRVAQQRRELGGGEGVGE